MASSTSISTFSSASHSASASRMSSHSVSTSSEMLEAGSHCANLRDNPARQHVTILCFVPLGYRSFLSARGSAKMRVPRMASTSNPSASSHPIPHRMRPPQHFSCCRACSGPPHSLARALRGTQFRVANPVHRLPNRWLRRSSPRGGSAAEGHELSIWLV